MENRGNVKTGSNLRGIKQVKIDEFLKRERGKTYLKSETVENFGILYEE